MQLVDTNVISELCRREPDAGVLAWAETQSALTLSIVTVEEIAFGLSWRPNPVLLAWFERLLAQHTVLPVDAGIARHAGMMRGRFAARGLTRTHDRIAFSIDEMIRSAASVQPMWRSIISADRISEPGLT